MMFVRGRWLFLFRSALWLCVLGGPAWPDGEVLLRFDTTTDRVVVADVASHQTGASDGAKQEIDSQTVILSHYRPWEDDTVLYDEYDLGGWVKMTVDGEPVIDSPKSAGFGSCTTMWLTPSGYVLERMSAKTESDPLTELSDLIENYSVELPAHPVKPGDSWERPNSVAFGEGSASVLLSWSFERTEERDGRTFAILHCRAEATIQDLEGPARPVSVGQFVGCKRRDMVHEYTLVDDCTVTWDVEAGYSILEEGDVTITGRITTEYIGPDGLAVSTKPDVAFARQGHRTIATREPTDTELVLAAALTIPNSIARGQAGLLESAAADDLDLAAVKSSLAPLFERYVTVEAKPSDVQTTLDGDNATVSYALELVGTIGPEGLALDVGSVEQTLKARVTVGLAREEARWRVRYVTWQPAG